MKNNGIKLYSETSNYEFILPGHPDKLCDRIADRLVDAACTRDPKSLVGVEVALHQQVVLVTGCITTVPV